MSDMIDRNAVLAKLDEMIAAAEGVAEIEKRNGINLWASIIVATTRDCQAAIRAIPAADARAEALKEAAAVAAKFDSDGMYGAAAIHDAILAIAPTTTTR